MKIIVEVSARHVHLDANDCQKLFGNTELTVRNQLSQKGEFAANETVEVAGLKGRFAKVRILGPLRHESQVEVSITDAFYLGVEAPLELSGSGIGEQIHLIGPKGDLIKPIIMIAERHLHLSPENAQKLEVKDGQSVKVRVGGPRAIVFENVIVRISENFKNHLHIDTDEGNAAAINKMTNGEVIK